MDIITAGTDALGGWNLIIPIAIAGITGLIAIVYKAVTAIKTLQIALATGGGIASVASGGVVGAIIAAVGLLATVATMIIGSFAASAKQEKTDYSSTIQSVSSYRDTVDALVTELETLAAKTELSAEEQARAETIMQTLCGTSLSMKEALENGGQGFDTLAEKAAAARGEVAKTEQSLRSLKAADALQNLRDVDKAYRTAVKEAQGSLTSVNQYGDIDAAYRQFMADHPEGTYLKEYPDMEFGSSVLIPENFYSYAQGKASERSHFWYSAEEKARIKEETAFWSNVVKEMNALEIGYSTSTEVIANKMLEFNIAATSYADANRQA